MNPYQVVEKFVAVLNEDIAAKKEHITSGNFPDLAAYKFECGILRGMCIALDELKKHAAQME